MSWLAKIDDKEYPVPSIATLRQWAKEGRLRPDHYVFNPTLQQWIYAKDTEELRGVWDAKAATAKSSSLNSISFSIFFLGLLLLWFSRFFGCSVMLVAIIVSIVGMATKKK